MHIENIFKLSGSCKIYARGMHIENVNLKYMGNKTHLQGKRIKKTTPIDWE